MKMAEVSNRVLAALLIVAIVVSLGGTMVSLNRIRMLSFVPVTGFDTTDTGEVGVNITAQAAMEFTKAGIDFGTGWVNSSNIVDDTDKRNCTMYISIILR